MGLHLTHRALADLAEVGAYSLAMWGEHLAAKYLDDLQTALDLVAEHPSLLTTRADLSLRLRFHRVREHVLICDRIQAQTYVLAVRHVAMDLPQRLLELEPQLALEAELLHRRIAREK